MCVCGLNYCTDHNNAVLARTPDGGAEPLVALAVQPLAEWVDAVACMRGGGEKREKQHVII